MRPCVGFEVYKNVGKKHPDASFKNVGEMHTMPHIKF